MVGKSKKLLGLTCLLLSLGLLTTKWVFNQNQTEFFKIEMQVNCLQLDHLTDDERLECIVELINLDKRLSQDLSTVESIRFLQKFGIDIEFPKRVQDEKMLSEFNFDKWMCIDTSTILKKLNAFIKRDKPSSRLAIVTKAYQSLKRNDFRAGLSYLEQISEPNMLDECVKYRINLASFVASKMIIIKAINKMTERIEIK